MVSFDIWIEGEVVHPHQQQKIAFVKEFQASADSKFITTPVLFGIKMRNVYGLTGEKTVPLNRQVSIHLPVYYKLPLSFEYEGLEGYHIMCENDSVSHSGDQTIEHANEGALGELRPALRFHLPKTLAEQFISLKVEFELINRQKLSALIAPDQLF